MFRIHEPNAVLPFKSLKKIMWQTGPRGSHAFHVELNHSLLLNSSTFVCLNSVSDTKLVPTSS
jgi:hypothetical protein